MNRILLISDDPGRSRDLAQDLLDGIPCEIHDLYADRAPVGPAAAIVTDVHDVGSETVGRLRRLLSRVCCGTPLVMLLHRDSAQARLAGVALGATRTFYAPFDRSRLRDEIGVSGSNCEPLTLRAERTSEEARRLYSAVFVRDRPITQVAIDTGTDLIGQAVRDTGIRDWVQAVRRFDDSTHQHCLLVAGLTAAFARTLGLGTLECHRLTKAALLHDVGKIHVPPAILNKPGKLDEAEMAIVRLHPEQGCRLLSGQGFGPEMLAVVRSHHEMLDGSGYPDRLKQDDIPDLVRLVTVCDIYAALIERRSYKPPMTGMAAFAILDGMAGRLDPVVVSAFRPVAAAFAPDFTRDM